MMDVVGTAVQATRAIEAAASTNGSMRPNRVIAAKSCGDLLTPRSECSSPGVSPRGHEMGVTASLPQGGRRKSTIAVRTGSNSTTDDKEDPDVDPDLIARLDPLVADLVRVCARGRRALRQSNVKGAAEILEEALDNVIPMSKREAARKQHHDEPPAAKVRGKSPRQSRQIRRISLPMSDEVQEALLLRKPTKHELVGQILQLLCVCYSKLRKWKAVCEVADLALEVGACPLEEDLRAELLLRRGVALSHLGNVDVAHPNFGALETAKADLAEVLQKRPRDPLAKSSMETIKFILAQAQASREPDEDYEPPLVGLARLRAMDP